MRFFIALVLVAGFLGGGGATLIAFLDVYAREGMTEDAGAALFISGMLLFIGFLLLAGAIRSRRRQKAIDANQMAATGFAHWMTMDHGDGGGDYGGD